MSNTAWRTVGNFFLSQSKRAITIGIDGIWYCVKTQDVKDVMEGLTKSGKVSAVPATKPIPNQPLATRINLQSEISQQFSTTSQPSRRPKTRKIQP